MAGNERNTLKLDSYYEWQIEKIRDRVREAAGVGGDCEILLAIIDSLLKQGDVEITGGPAYQALTASIRESRK